MNHGDHIKQIQTKAWQKYKAISPTVDLEKKGKMYVATLLFSTANRQQNTHTLVCVRSSIDHALNGLERLIETSSCHV